MSVKLSTDLITIATIKKLKEKKEKFACLTAYEATLAEKISNSGVEIAKVDNIPSPLTYTNYGAHNFTQEINSIGYDWKTFNLVEFLESIKNLIALQQAYNLL